MAIDAVVEKVEVLNTGNVCLHLVNRGNGIAGQKALFCLIIPEPELVETLKQLKGCEIWGSADTIVLGDVRIGDRSGYTRVSWYNSSIIDEAIKKYHARSQNS